MGVLAEIGASFRPGQYPKLARLPWIRTAGVLFLMALLVVAAIGIRGAETFAAVRGAAGEWLDRLPEMSVYQGRLTAATERPVLIESPGALFAVDPENVLNIQTLAAEYEALIVMRSAEIIAGGRSTSITSTPYPYTHQPFTSDDLRQLMGRISGLMPVILLIAGIVLWVWLGAAQLVWATVLSAAAYAMTAGARPRPSYARLWSLAGHALVPVVGFSAVNALLHFTRGTLGLGWPGIGAAVVFCVLGVNALLREETIPPAGPLAGPPAGSEETTVRPGATSDGPARGVPTEEPKPPLRPIL